MLGCNQVTLLTSAVQEWLARHSRSSPGGPRASELGLMSVNCRTRQPRIIHYTTKGPEALTG